MSIKQKSATGVLWGSFSTLYAQSVNIILFFYLAKILDVGAFGKLALALFLLELFVVFSSVGFNAYLLKTKEFTTAKANTCFSTSLLLSCSFILLVIFIINVFYSGIIDSGEAYYVFALCPILIMNSLGLVSESKIQREFNYRLTAKAMVICSSVSGSLSLVLALYGFDEWSIIIGRVLNSFLITILIVRYSKFFPRFQISTVEFKSIYQFIKPLFLSRIITFSSERTSQIVIATFLGPSFFALFALAKRPYTEIQQLSLGQINKVLVNTLSRSRDDHVEICYRLSLMVSAFIIPIFLGLSVVSETFVVNFLGDKWQQSATLMTLFGLEVFVLIFAWFTDSFFIATGNTKNIFKIVRIGFIIRLITSVIAVQFGLHALVLTNIAVSLAMLSVRYAYFTKIVNVSFYALLKNMSPSILAGLAMYTIVYFYIDMYSPVIDNSYLLLSSAVLLGGAAYLGMFYVSFNKKFKIIFHEVASLTKG